ncbi:MAG: hypothetical protein R3C45_13165 [Phycisphaerales bacterium]
MTGRTTCRASACPARSAKAGAFARTTTLIDHHASPNAIEGSLSQLEGGIAEAGCRGVLCYETTDRNHPNEARGLDENERFVILCKKRSNGRGSPAWSAAHASFTSTTIRSITASSSQKNFRRRRPHPRRRGPLR